MQVLMAVIALYLVLGTFMEELSMMISTIPITTPLMVQAGYDSVWYGILIVLLIQTAMISPPFGINLFVIQGIRGRGKLSDVETRLGAVRDRAADHDRDDLRLAGDRDVGAARFSGS
jgi:TRAP-type C4-dicarboxylate transport system permease large subunit